jgi:hypothetical protein
LTGRGRYHTQPDGSGQKPAAAQIFLSSTGDEIRVIDGPFTNFNGTVEEVNPEKGKIKGAGEYFWAVDTGGTGFCPSNEIIDHSLGIESLRESIEKWQKR